MYTDLFKGPMGVGAIFISTLALTRLPVPSNPPVGQIEILAASLHPIVSFVVLCSILIRKSHCECSIVNLIYHSFNRWSVNPGVLVRP